MAKIKLLLKLTFTCLFGLLFGLLLLEIGLHYTSFWLPASLQNLLQLPSAQGVQRFSSTILAREHALGWKFRSNLDVKVIGVEGPYVLQTVQIGNHAEIGFRDDGIQFPVYAMAVGDSFTDGWSIEASENWVERLENRMGRDWINMGTRGWSSRQYAQIINDFYPELQPELVVWTFFINDFNETGLHNQLLQEQRENSVATAINEFLQNHSVLWDLYRLRISVGFYGFQKSATIYHYTQDNLDLTLFPDLWDNQINPRMPLVQDGIETTEKLLIETAQIVRGQGSEFLLLIAPAAEQVYLQLLRDQMDLSTFTAATGKADFAYLDHSTKHLLQFCEEQALHCLDLTPAFRQLAAQQVQLYLPGDQHWNEAGNQLAADTLYNYLQANGSVP